MQETCKNCVLSKDNQRCIYWYREAKLREKPCWYFYPTAEAMKNENREATKSL